MQAAGTADSVDSTRLPANVGWPRLVACSQGYGIARERTLLAGTWIALAKKDFCHYGMAHGFPLRSRQSSFEEKTGDGFPRSAVTFWSFSSYTLGFLRVAGADRRHIHVRGC